ncbi:N-acetyltransferase [Photobacterium sp. ZSDE20]|uniref:N-acetyltransferase n=1 Tax=Photobacterium pectinilyticum TaxID=2906793 RepID=A0ABT1N875_9GAMM|nr:GNAT family N-acetyltransferase [Photobacterium sp. ZSDE20]MCQ1060044.1 N-acetyltransferase [Photobacterium sp. ZSDE20]MDD1826979.1 N-acetyltransferase [Photobacterium sp. ZSDE20]
MVHYKAVHDIENQTYFVDLVEGYQAKVSYQISGNVLTLDHSSVPEALRGKGYASVMMEAVLSKIEQEGYTVIPVCSYVIHYMKKHNEWQHLLAKKEP